MERRASGKTFERRGVVQHCKGEVRSSAVSEEVGGKERREDGQDIQIDREMESEGIGRSVGEMYSFSSQGCSSFK